MEQLTLEEIVKVVNGKVDINGECRKYNYLSTDTRKLRNNSIFVALRGENFNGNDYVKEASEKGANLCIVDQIKFNPDELKGNTSIILVEDTKQALLSLAEYYRSKLNVKVIGITGSTGKTSTKDLLAAFLSSKFKVFKTKGNFNNEIGLPLMIFELDNTYDIAVLEMGMSDLGEIHRLAKVARPDVAIITNVGISHIENLKTRENILKAKMEITDYFNDNNILIINIENDLLSSIPSDKYKVVKVGFNKESDYKADNVTLNQSFIEFVVSDDNNEEEFHIDIPGKHNILNALLGIAAGKILGIEYEEMKSGIKNLSVTSMRLDIIKNEKITIIDDCYNASPDSMKAALDVMNSIEGKRKIAVLGTMKELGDKANESHKLIAEYASKQGVDILVTIGEFNDAYREGFKNDKGFKSFENNNNASEFLLNNTNNGDVILVKASRSMKFESIVNKLKAEN
ncbi:UDP-N-acetylmuramoyl-tripeptide--D-alanyl-D-alanine ligase [Clostridium aestuarii]|uniref:UDP-N-acetylmuramoyl-tripeptide--D-alanyl-D-alanine ligase n=1 Tax=Clostridium aestuarii TaxID=338193 RepID=A0ABT4D0L8_9CLOT|nr:UDP-N-acetylmuramoyl-tripeptide--D-alanyl-D-alanine ligase [Clostridium aestuarii]